MTAAAVAVDATSVADIVDVIKDKEQTTIKMNKALKPSDRLEEFLKLMDEENLHELEIVDGAFQIKLVRQPLAPMMPVAMHSSRPHHGAPASQKTEVEEVGTPIKSPLAGVFYRAPSPNAPVFVKEGDVVTSDKTLCIIEAMKVLNEINAGVNGKIIKIMVENGKPVKSGQTLFLVEPS